MVFFSHKTAISLLFISLCLLVYSSPIGHHLGVVPLFNSSDRVASFGFLAGFYSSSVFSPPIQQYLCILLIHPLAIVVVTEKV